jgi:hypothetical protein
MHTRIGYARRLVGLLLLSCACAAAQVTYKPYIQSGDLRGFGPTDQEVIAWQTAEMAPNPAYHVEFGETPALGSSVVPSGRVVGNYLAADSSLPVPPTATGPHVNYYAVPKGLEFDTTYFYRVTGPGLPGGFTSHFHTRKRSGRFSFLVQGDEGFFPAVPGIQSAPACRFRGPHYPSDVQRPSSLVSRRALSAPTGPCTEHRRQCLYLRIGRKLS